MSLYAFYLFLVLELWLRWRCYFYLPSFNWVPCWWTIFPTLVFRLEAAGLVFFRPGIFLLTGRSYSIFFLKGKAEKSSNRSSWMVLIIAVAPLFCFEKSYSFKAIICSSNCSSEFNFLPFEDSSLFFLILGDLVPFMLFYKEGFAFFLDFLLMKWGLFSLSSLINSADLFFIKRDSSWIFSFYLKAGIF